MFTHYISRFVKQSPPSIGVENGSRVAVIGGGPAGSFFSYFLLQLAERMDLTLNVEIYEPRDFSLPAPKGCNMCAGVISETLIQNLAREGINLPASVIQEVVDSYVLHTDLGSQIIHAAVAEKRIVTLFRGRGPRDVQADSFQGFDHYLLMLARNKGANLISRRVTGVARGDGCIYVQTGKSSIAEYDLLVVAAGVNTAILNQLLDSGCQYIPPATTRAAIREYHLGRETVEKTFSSSPHVFLLDIPRLDFAMVVPKGEYVSVCLLGKDVDEGLIQAFLTAIAVKACFPAGWRSDQHVCGCFPRMNVQAAHHPLANHIVFIGDSGTTRLFKDGIGTAYRAAKAAAACAVLEGIASTDFRRYYAPFCKSVVIDNAFGKFIITVTRIFQRLHFARSALLRALAREQQTSGIPRYMSSVVWDIFTGSAPYLDVFLRSVHPLFISSFIWSLIGV